MKAAVRPLLDTEPVHEEASPMAAGLPTGVDLLGRLEGIIAGRGLNALASRLGDLADFVALDLASFETLFADLSRLDDRVGAAVGHLLDRGGKRLRPLCVILASKLGEDSRQTALDLGIAVELVHSATLLHDDVVDHGTTRRGAPTARTVYGNAASIFAGDWLLVEALRRVERCRMSDLLVRLLDTIEAMIAAEAIQLDNRGRLNTVLDDYMRVVEGKTASVFRWAMWAGGRAGGLDEPVLHALDTYGLHLGVAFQAVDDLLDITGNSDRTGKSLFADLREGKMTYPMILGLERDRPLRPLVEQILTAPADQEIAEDVATRVIASLRRSHAARDGLRFARERARLAREALSAVPMGRARRALETVAESIVDRDL
jgi:octaprenyl-diphosphate synthase